MKLHGTRLIVFGLDTGRSSISPVTTVIENCEIISLNLLQLVNFGERLVPFQVTLHYFIIKDISKQR